MQELQGPLQHAIVTTRELLTRTSQVLLNFTLLQHSVHLLGSTLEGFLIVGDYLARDPLSESSTRGRQEIEVNGLHNATSEKTQPHLAGLCATRVLHIHWSSKINSSECEGGVLTHTELR